MGVGIGQLVIGAAAAAQLVALSVPWRYRELFVRVAKDTGTDENLLHAIAWQESNLEPTAIGASNTNGTRDYGMMQINQVNFATLGLTQVTALDAERNVRAGAQLVQQLSTRFGFLDAISAYNAGARDRNPIVAGTQIRNQDGGFINPGYVASVWGRYALVQIAALAPVKVA